MQKRFGAWLKVSDPRYVKKDPGYGSGWLDSRTLEFRLDSNASVKRPCKMYQKLVDAQR
jgi:hypothetical protein